MHLVYTAQTNPDFNGNGILDTWEMAKFGNTNAGANLANSDPDGDRLSNLLEFALGSDPLAATASPLLYELEQLGDGEHLRLTLPKNAAATNMTYIVETCDTLNDWSTANTTIELNTATQLIVRDNYTSDTASCRYIRLRVTTTP